jgi:hypothetical protein
VSGGAPIESVEVVEVIKTMATKVRFAVRFAGMTRAAAFASKAFLDVDAATAKGGATTVREADFYGQLAPLVSVRTPDLRELHHRSRGSAGRHHHARSHQGRRALLHGIGSLHGGASCAEPGADREAPRGRRAARAIPWIDHRIAQLAQAQYVPQPLLQELLDGPRGEGLLARTRDAAVLIAGMKAWRTKIPSRNKRWCMAMRTPETYIASADGSGPPGLIDWQLLQKGSWALDVPYHICAVLEAADAEREERRLLSHYLDTVRALGRRYAGSRSRLDAVPRMHRLWLLSLVDHPSGGSCDHQCLRAAPRARGDAA